MNELIKDLESSAKGSRELDRLVLLASGWYVNADGYWWARNGNLGFHGKKEIHLLPQPTTSLDAALVLEPKDIGIDLSITPHISAASIQGYDADTGRKWRCHSYADTPALAVCVVKLKAKERA